MDPAAGNLLHVARLTGVEVVSALARRLRSGSLSSAHAAAALTRFRTDFRTRFHIVGIRVALVNRAMRLTERHFLRAYDAVQLAAALQVHRRCLALGQSLNWFPLTLTSMQRPSRKDCSLMIRTTIHKEERSRSGTSYLSPEEIYDVPFLLFVSPRRPNVVEITPERREQRSRPRRTRRSRVARSPPAIPPRAASRPSTLPRPCRPSPAVPARL